MSTYPPLEHVAESKTSHTISADVLNVEHASMLCVRIHAELDAIQPGRWSVISYIGGRRGKTAVILAKDWNCGIVAIKLACCKTDKVKKRFKREVKVMKRVAHSNVIRCMDGPFESRDGTLMLCVLEWIQGDSLRELRENTAARRLPEETVIQMGVDILNGLNVVHKQGVVHCDLKCQNIMCTTDGRFKLIDFGISFIDESIRNDVSKSMMTSERQPGTKFYMSPEQIEYLIANENNEPHKDYSFPSDIWAMGVIMYINLTGKYPYTHNQTDDTRFKILEDHPAPLDNVSDCLSKIVLQALQKDPARRYKSAKAMLDALTLLTIHKPLPSGCKWHFFICKSESAGAQGAMNICHELRLKGYKIWISNDRKCPNDLAMREGVQKSAVFLVYLTKGIFSSYFCREVEMREAVKHKKPFVVLTCKKGDFKFDVGHKDQELRNAPATFRPFGEQLFKRSVFEDWALNVRYRHKIIEDLEDKYDERQKIADELYGDGDFLWGPSECNEENVHPVEEKKETPTPIPTAPRTQISDRAYERNIPQTILHPSSMEFLRAVNKTRGNVRPGALFNACRRGDIQAVRETLLGQGVDVNEKDEEGQTSLFVSVHKGHLDIASILLSVEGVDVNQANKSGATPLYIACFAGYTSIVQSITSKEDCAVNQTNKYGYTPLYIACVKGHEDVVTTLLMADCLDPNHADKDGATPLYTACQHGHVNIVKKLLKKDGINVNLANKKGSTPLWIASWKGHVDIVIELLNNEGVDTNQAGENESTPLWVACENGNVAVVRALLSSNRVDINRPNKDMATPLDVANERNRSEIILLLQNAGAMTQKLA